MTTLVEFLRARIAEDQAATHVERMLAECDARRRILDYAEQRGIGRMSGDPAVLGALDEVLKALALPYAEHPDHLAEWAPDTP